MGRGAVPAPGNHEIITRHLWDAGKVYHKRNFESNYSATSTISPGWCVCLVAGYGQCLRESSLA